MTEDTTPRECGRQEPSGRTCPFGTIQEAKNLKEVIRRNMNLVATQGSILKRHSKTLYGNGRIGLVESGTRIEERLASVLNWQKIMTGALVSLVLAILIYLLTTHHTHVQ